MIPPCAHVIGNTPLNPRKKFIVFFSRDILGGLPLRPFRVTQICKVFSAGEIGEGPARELNSRPSAAVSIAGIRCRVMFISFCLQDRGYTGDADGSPMETRPARRPGGALNPNDYSSITLPSTQ